jgi:hypothetical protein
MKRWGGSTDGVRPRQATGVAEVLGAVWATPHLGRHLAALPAVGAAAHTTEQMANMNMNSQSQCTDCNCNCSM